MMQYLTSPHAQMLSTFDAMATRIRNAVKNRPIIFFINPGNWGDSLIREGAERFLLHYNFPYRAIRFKDIIKGRKKLEDEILACGHSSPAMVYNGNGIFNASYGFPKLIADLTHKFDTSIFLPSTYAVNMSELGFSPSSIFFVRDKFESQEQMPNAQFCHDMAFFLEPKRSAPGIGDFWCLRRDSESPQGLKLPISNIDLSRGGRAHTPVGPLLDRLSRYNTIHTNRLHIGIAGALLGCNVHLYANNYFKIRAIYQSSIEPYFPNVHFENTPPSPEGKGQKWYHRLKYR